MKGPPGKITQKPEAVPHCDTTARIIPFAVMSKVESELKHMEDEGIATKVTDPTDLCAPIATAFRMGMYACAWTWRNLQTVKREHYMLPNLDDIAPKLRKATAFSKLDASSGFHQIPLDRESCHLSTFVTLIGRKWFQRVHFRITSTSEIFQRLMSEIFADIDWDDAIIDDVIVIHRGT